MSRPHIEAVFDTNILIDYLMGRDEAQQEFDRYSRRGISIVTWMELQIGSRTEAEADVIDLFLREFRVIEITRQVATRAAEIRRRHSSADAGRDHLGHCPDGVGSTRDAQHEGLSEGRSCDSRSLLDRQYVARAGYVKPDVLPRP